MNGLEVQYADLNQKFFRGRLPKYAIELRPRSEMRSTLGECRWDEQKILLHEDLTNEGKRRTLLHEMCHVAAPKSHNKKFVAQLQRLVRLGETWAASEVERYTLFGDIPHCFVQPGTLVKTSTGELVPVEQLPVLTWHDLLGSLKDSLLSADDRYSIESILKNLDDSDWWEMSSSESVLTQNSTERRMLGKYGAAKRSVQDQLRLLRAAVQRFEYARDQVRLAQSARFMEERERPTLHHDDTPRMWVVVYAPTQEAGSLFTTHALPPGHPQ